MRKVDMAFVRRMARRATKLCRKEFEEIECHVPTLIDPNRRIPARRRRELLAILEQIGESRRAVYGRT